MLMCVLLHLLICTALRAHIIVAEALYKIYYYYFLVCNTICTEWMVTLHLIYHSVYRVMNNTAPYLPQYVQSDE